MPNKFERPDKRDLFRDGKKKLREDKRFMRLEACETFHRAKEAIQV